MGTWRAVLRALATVWAGALAIGTLAGIAGWPQPVAGAIRDIFATNFVWVFLTPSSIAVVAMILLLEERFPAVDRDRLPAGVFQDGLYFFVSQPFAWWLFATGGPALDDWLAAEVPWLVFEGAEQWPAWLSITLAFLIADFLFWFGHLLRHKIPVLWRFHAIHHSQTDYNMFTDRRVHLFDSLSGNLISWLPLFIVGPDLRVFTLEIIGIRLFLGWYPILYHGNIRTNMGPLRYIIVTPQAHRIHHSREEQHFDTNFGLILSIWDRMFGTYSGAKGDFPYTGTPDRNLPMETSRNPIDLMQTYILQFLYPFRRQSVVKARAAASATVPAGVDPSGPLVEQLSSS